MHRASPVAPSQMPSSVWWTSNSCPCPLAWSIPYATQSLVLWRCVWMPVRPLKVWSSLENLSRPPYCNFVDRLCGGCGSWLGIMLVFYFIYQIILRWSVHRLLRLVLWLLSHNRATTATNVFSDAASSTDTIIVEIVHVPIYKLFFFSFYYTTPCVWLFDSTNIPCLFFHSSVTITETKWKYVFVSLCVWWNSLSLWPIMFPAIYLISLLLPLIYWLPFPLFHSFYVSCCFSFTVYT